MCVSVAVLCEYYMVVFLNQLYQLASDRQGKIKLVDGQISIREILYGAWKRFSPKIPSSQAKLE